MGRVGLPLGAAVGCERACIWLGMREARFQSLVEASRKAVVAVIHHQEPSPRVLFQITSGLKRPHFPLREKTPINVNSRC